MPQDLVKIYNRTKGIIKLARTGKIEIPIQPKRDKLIRLNEIEDDERLQASIKQKIARGFISVTIDNVIDGTIPGLTGDDVVTAYDSERVFAITAFPPEAALGQIVLRVDLDDLYWWDGTTWRLIGAGASPDEKTKISAADTTTGFLDDKIVVSGGITKTILSPGADEDLAIGFDPLAAGVKVRDYALSVDKRVPGNGTRYLMYGRVVTSAAPLVLTSAGKFVSGSVRVDKLDGSRVYRVEFLVNAAVVEFIDLPVSTLKAVKTTFSTTFASTDEISARIRRTSGSGASTFRNATVSLEIAETA